MKFDNQLRYATNIISSYQGEEPLHSWLKDFFRVHKQMGSRDRKTVSGLVYGYYRLGHAVRGMAVDQRVLLGLFLMQDQPGEFLEYFHPEWNALGGAGLEKKLVAVRGTGIDFDVTDIFPWKDQLSEGVDHTAFCLSFLRQPDLFLRIRPGQESLVPGKLTSLPHEFTPPFTLRLPNGFKVEELFTPDKEVVIQDMSSQRLAEFLEHAKGFVPRAFWDACAGSGGKSILAHDLMPTMYITASDIRESILRNLRQRFRQAGIGNYHSFIADLTKDHEDTEPFPYDLILADVPCTGSGTWSRTPEELFFFNPQKIHSYHTVQKRIVSHIIPRLMKGAHLVYSTCSVFRRENDEMADYISGQLGLEKMSILKGYDQKADTMFAARFSYDR